MANAPEFTLPADSWLGRAEHRNWLQREALRLIDFYRAARHPQGGFAALDSEGRLPPDAAPDTILTARLVHCFSIAALQGIPGTASLAAEGVAALSHLFHDDDYGGWLSGALTLDRSDIDPAPEGASAKMAYLHIFVCLGAASATVADIPGARALLDEAVDVIETRFWSEEEGAIIDGFSRDWQQQEAYRGGNSNMHATELCLALADVLGAPIWRQRALSIATRIVHEGTAQRNGQLIEHFHADWSPWKDYHRSQPMDELRPYGITPGHACEWSRLLLELEAALQAHGEPAPAWLFEDAEQLFDAGIHQGWHVDGSPGLIYTHDFDGRPSVQQRIHWTTAEAASAASAFLKRTRNPRYEMLYRLLWDYIARYLIDYRGGSWWHEVNVENQPEAKIWPGKPDLYHALQSTMIPRYPLTPVLSVSLARGNTALNPSPHSVF